MRGGGDHGPQVVVADAAAVAQVQADEMEERREGGREATQRREAWRTKKRYSNSCKRANFICFSLLLRNFPTLLVLSLSHDMFSDAFYCV